MTVQEAKEWLKVWSATHQNENENIREAVWCGVAAHCYGVSGDAEWPAAEGRRRGRRV